MAWTVTITAKSYSADGITATVAFDNGSGIQFSQTYNTLDGGNSNFPKSEAKATLQNIKALISVYQGYNVNDTITGIGN